MELARLAGYLAVAVFILVPTAVSVEPTFKRVDIPVFGGEPNLEVAPDGTVYVVHPDWPGSRIWRLAPGDPAFVDLGRPNLGFGGADEDIAVGPNGLLAVAGMYPDGNFASSGYCTSVTVSRDGGDSWEATIAGICGLPEVDRPFIAIDEHAAIWVLQHAYCCLGQHSLHHSRDGAVYAPVGISSAISGFPGNLVAANGRLYTASGCTAPGPAVCLASTTTLAPQPVWTPAVPLRAGSALPGLGHSTVAVDDGGDLYLAFPTSSGGSAVRVARSTDGGLSWSTPERLTQNAATMPWIVAGAHGRVAVAWYEANMPGDANTMPASATWNVRLAIRTSWSEPWETFTVSQTPNHRGPLCVNGFACHAQGIDRDLLDYFEIALGPDGHVHLVWSDDVSWVVRYAEMTSGPFLR